jgi:large subunit ribosomal protein L16
MLISKIFFQQTRNVANFRPKKMKYKKSFQGFFHERMESLRGSACIRGDYGLQTLEGGRLSDTQIDVCRQLIKKQIKNEKLSLFYLTCFPDRPVTSQPLETRMGKGKGSVEYFATWVRPGRVLFEIKNARKEVALKALKSAGICLPLKTRVVEKGSVQPRVLPWFIKERLRNNEMISKIQELDAKV